MGGEVGGVREYLKVWIYKLGNLHSLKLLFLIKGPNHGMRNNN